ncbi:hypothetical protein FG386_001265, partial [Cryptosporidium ryanae]|uniref:uncharacterized protein n=1 Tax=Cryptosporidium ryanae TaxID=515981 RepID=UPI00351A1A38
NITNNNQKSNSQKTSNITNNNQKSNNITNNNQKTSNITNNNQKSNNITNNNQKASNITNNKVCNSEEESIKTTDVNKDNIKGIKDISKVISNCIALNTTYKYDTNWYLTEQNKMGPFGWFDGKYTIPGWKTMEMSYESFDFDFLDAEKLSNGTYILTSDYFNSLIETLNSILPVIAQRIAFIDLNKNITKGILMNNKVNIDEEITKDNDIMINIEEAPTTLNDNRQNAYLKYRTNYELIPAQEIYCT